MIKEISKDPLIHSYWFEKIERIKKFHNSEENYIGLSMEDLIAGLCIEAYKQGKEDGSKS